MASSHVAGPPTPDRPASDQWGALTEEPCRYCHRQGGVQFWLSSHPLDNNGPQVVQCILCKNVWNADRGTA